MESILLQQTDYMTIYRTLRDGLETLVDTRKLTQVSDTMDYRFRIFPSLNRTDRTKTLQSMGKVSNAVAAHQKTFQIILKESLRKMY